MAVDPKQKLEALNSELEQIVKNYNQATQVAKKKELTEEELEKIILNITYIHIQICKLLLKKCYFYLYKHDKIS